jgi:predicted Rdx family selenoprotein
MVNDNSRSEDPRLGPGSLYAKIPIPACRALTYAGQVKASQVLFALSLHSSGSNPIVFPNRKTIVKYSGVGKDSISEALKVLVKFGFIKISYIKVGRTSRNQYEILRACFHWDELNEVASRYKVPKGYCTRCSHWIYRGGWSVQEGKDGLATVQVRIHKICGGIVRDLTRKQMLNIRSQEESGGIGLCFDTRQEVISKDDNS